MSRERTKRSGGGDDDDDDREKTYTQLTQIYYNAKYAELNIFLSFLFCFFLLL